MDEYSIAHANSHTPFHEHSRNKSPGSFMISTHSSLHSEALVAGYMMYDV